MKGILYKCRVDIRSGAVLQWTCIQDSYRNWLEAVVDYDGKHSVLVETLESAEHALEVGRKARTQYLIDEGVGI